MTARDPAEADPINSQIKAALNAYKLAAQDSGWPQIKTLTKPRRSKLLARLKDAGGIEGWQTAIERAQKSAHCCGHNERGWIINFDFLVTASSFTRLMEGNYDNRAPKQRAGAETASARVHRMINEGKL